jgi:tRNA (uracil-5-)-methyltransferase TRM9
MGMRFDMGTSSAIPSLNGDTPSAQSFLPDETHAVGEGEGEGAGQDVLVPWVLQKRPTPRTRPTKPTASTAKANVNAKASISAYTDHKKGIDAAVDVPVSDGDAEQVYHRYYHLFRHGELHQLVEEAAVAEGFHLRPDDGVSRGEGNATKWLGGLKEGWELDNWWLEGEVGLL